MCGRFLLATRPDIVIERFDARLPFDDFGPRYNIAPGQFSPVLKQNKRNEFSKAKWGLKWKNMPKLPPAINIRSESIRDKKGWLSSLKTRRCIIPATGFYEWRKGEKQPFHITLKDTPLFPFAGLFQYREKDEIYAFAIITVDAPKELIHVHHRAPKILNPDEEIAWMNDAIKPEEAIDILLDPLNFSWVIEKASIRVNKVINDDPDILSPDPEQEQLL